MLPLEHDDVAIRPHPMEIADGLARLRGDVEEAGRHVEVQGGHDKRRDLTRPLRCCATSEARRPLARRAQGGCTPCLGASHLEGLRPRDVVASRCLGAAKLFPTQHCCLAPGPAAHHADVVATLQHPLRLTPLHELLVQDLLPSRQGAAHLESGWSRRNVEEVGVHGQQPLLLTHAHTCATFGSE